MSPDFDSTFLKIISMDADKQKISRRDFLKLAGMFSAGAALAACTPTAVQAPTLDPSEILPTNQPEIQKEKLKPFGQFVIGASGAGTIREFNEVENPDPVIVDKISKLARENIPDITNDPVTVHWYDMVGDKDTKPFCLVTVKSSKDQKNYNFAAFWVDEKGVTRPPEDGKVYAFYPLMEKKEKNGTYTGIPDITNTQMEKPGLFYIPSLPVPNQVFFIPPYTDDDPSKRDGYGIKTAKLAPIVPEFPTIPQEVLDKLPNNWSITRDTKNNTWYIVDQTTAGKNIWRFSEENKTWQERHDVTVGGKNYEGWVVGKGNKDIQKGDIAPLEMIRTQNIPDFNVTATDLLDGYVTDYKTVEVTDGIDIANIVYFTLRYFRKNGTKIDVMFSADNDYLLTSPGYKFDIKVNLGKKCNINLLAPNGDLFTESTIATFAKNTKVSGLRKNIMYYGSGEWVRMNTLLSELKNPVVNKLNLEHKTLVGFLTISS